MRVTKQKRPTKILLSLLALIVVLALLRLILIVNLSETSWQYNAIEQQIRSQQADNAAIRAKLLENQSLTVIATKAASQGFVAGHTGYLGSDGKIHTIKTANQ